VFNYAELTNDYISGQDMDNLQYTLFIGRSYYKGNLILQAINENQSEVGASASDQGTGDKAGEGIYRYVGMVGVEASGYDGSRETFIGANNTYANPAAVAQGKCFNSLNYTLNTTGTMQADIVLQPGEEKQLVYILGPGKEAQGRAIMSTYEEPGRVEQELQQLRTFWHDQIGGFSVQTPDANFNSMVNVWNAYQCFITFSWSRAASLLYISGRNGLGYRDTVQDIQGIMHLDAERAASRLSLMLSGQLSSGGGMPLVPFDHVPGTAQPPHDPLEYRCDDALWLFPSVSMYVRESGNVDYLTTSIPYADTGSATVYEHLRRALQFSLERLGEHGLVLGLHADWNDCLRLGDKGESLFASFQLYWAFELFAECARLLNKQSDIEWAGAQQQILSKNLMDHAWEGDQFVRAFSSTDGYVVGSKHNEEGSLFLNSQTWAVISGAATREMALKAMDKVHKQLATAYGAMLCYPAFRNYGLPVVRSVLFLPGVKENAGIFSHTQGWLVLAEALLGRGDRAMEYYNSVNPARMNDQAEIRGIEPYVHGQFTEGTESPYHGRSHNPWLSGTASTMMVGAVQGILGMRPEVDGLRIDPSIPASWDGFSMRRKFRGSWLVIEVKNPKHVEHGIVSTTLNGVKLADNLIAAGALKAGDNKVEIVLG
jgi:cellobiose phosphorylase